MCIMYMGVCVCVFMMFLLDEACDRLMDKMPSKTWLNFSSALLLHLTQTLNFNFLYRKPI